MAFTENRTLNGLTIPGPQDLIRKARKWHRRQSKRREIEKLLDYEPWILKDMGVTRSDVVEALAFRGDASLHLRSLAARRKFWSRYNERI